MRKEIMIKIPLERYEQLIVVEARAALLTGLVTDRSVCWPGRCGGLSWS